METGAEAPKKVRRVRESLPQRASNAIAARLEAGQHERENADLQWIQDYLSKNRGMILSTRIFLESELSKTKQKDEFPRGVRCLSLTKT
eukprot:627083-Lingulodinium_polyedra.AAC.1